MENSCAVFVKGVKIEGQSRPELKEEDFPKVLLDKLQKQGTITRIETLTMYLVEYINLYHIELLLLEGYI